MSGDDAQHLRQGTKLENNNLFYTRFDPPTGPRTQHLSLVSQQRRRGETDEKLLMREVYNRLRAEGKIRENMPKTQQHHIVMRALQKHPGRHGRYPRGYGYESFCTIDRPKAK